MQIPLALQRGRVAIGWPKILLLAEEVASALIIEAPDRAFELEQSRWAASLCSLFPWFLWLMQVTPPACMRWVEAAKWRCQCQYRGCNHPQSPVGSLCNLHEAICVALQPTLIQRPVVRL